MLKPSTITSAILLSTSLMLTACGGSSSSSKDSSEDLNTTKTGVFVDSPVANIAYRTETHSGFTDSNGEFLFENGETVISVE